MVGWRDPRWAISFCTAGQHFDGCIIRDEQRYCTRPKPCDRQGTIECTLSRLKANQERGGEIPFAEQVIVESIMACSEHQHSLKCFSQAGETRAFGAVTM